MKNIITLTTDFGTDDHYVGTMRGVILNINPAAEIIDICHSVQSYDVLDGALTIAQAYSFFPPGTVHVVVVDPGVGTARRPILVDAGNYRFVAPDNGVLSCIYAREEQPVVRHITASHYFLHPVSATFHGRDVFAPVAAYVSKGVALSMLGDVIDNYVRFTLNRPEPSGDNRWRGVVLKVDKFGNLVTNIRPQDVPQFMQPDPPAFRIAVGNGEVRTLRHAFGEGKPGEAFAIIGSMGFVEIVVNQGSAAQALGARKGSQVAVFVEPGQRNANVGNPAEMQNPGVRS